MGYDSDGNLNVLERSNRTTRYLYDAENRLIRLEPQSPVEGDARLFFGYDYMGRRVSKVVERYRAGLWCKTASLGFVYDGWHLVLEEDQQTKSSRYFIWGLDLSRSLQGSGGIGGLLASVQDSQEYLFFYDANGNVVQLVESSDNRLAAGYVYAPFGNIVSQSGDLARLNRFRFSTKYFDHESQLYYYGYRFYSPELGRWITRDPIEEEGGLNLYGFVQNDPVNKVDPMGLKAHNSCVRDCPNGRWSVDIGFNSSLVIGLGANRSNVKFTCLSTGKECNGVIDCAVFGPIVDLSLGGSVDFDVVGTGSIISEYYSNSSIENYHFSSWIIVAGLVGTSGNNVNVTAGASLGVGKQFCTAKMIVCED